MSNYCTKCGKQLKPDEKYCGNCGTPNDEITQTSEKKPVTQPLNTQCLPSDSNSHENGNPLQQTVQSKRGVMKGILCVAVAMGLLFYFFGTTSKKQQETTTQIQTQQPNPAKPEKPRKDFGEVDFFWKALEATMVTKDGSGYSIQRGKEGLLTKNNGSRYIVPDNNIKNGSTPIFIETDSDHVTEVKVRLHHMKYRGDTAFDYAYFGFILGCFLVVETVSPEMPQEEREQFLMQINVITDKPEPGKWVQIYNDVEYTYENNIDIEGGLKFSAKIANTKGKK